MDTILKNKIKKHQRVLTAYITQLAKERNESLGNDMTYQSIIDIKGNHFQLVRMGWHKDRFLYSVLIHFDISLLTGNIWVQQNNTEIPIDEDLAVYGVSKKNIVVGFHLEAMRPFSDFAIA
jgi:XisI protein